MMALLALNENLSNGINIMAVLLSIAGFLFLTYEFFNKWHVLGWILRIALPLLIGFLLLAPVGVVNYAYAGDPRLLNGAVAYGLVGAIIGVFNGGFVKWPPKEKPRKISWCHGMIGFVISVPAWAFVGHITLPASASLTDLGIIGLSVGAATGVVASVWRALSWEPQFRNENNQRPTRPLFSRTRACVGLAAGFLPTFVIGWLLGGPIDGLLIGLALGALGAGIGGFWPVLGWEPQLPGKQEKRFSWTTFDWTRGGVGLLLAGAGGALAGNLLELTSGEALVTGECLGLAGFLAFGLWPGLGAWDYAVKRFFHPGKPPSTSASLETSGTPHSPLTGADAGGTPPAPADMGAGGAARPAQSRSKGKQSADANAGASPNALDGDPFAGQEAARPFPPVFSAGGLVLGLCTALLLGFSSVLMSELVFGNLPWIILQATLRTTAFIGLAGALIGAFSRYFFWWVDSFDKDTSLGIGAIITILGFALQLIPLVSSLF